ncbi:MAG: hypothetical protein C0518_09380 [Opitutus sp.]|nr:hypothetical protein [Opitutus sp.]
MKKIIPLLAVIAVFFVGCGRQDSTRGSTSESNATRSDTTATPPAGTATVTSDGTTTQPSTTTPTDPNAPKKN